MEWYLYGLSKRKCLREVLYKLNFANLYAFFYPFHVQKIDIPVKKIIGETYFHLYINPLVGHGTDTSPLTDIFSFSFNSECM